MTKEIKSNVKIRRGCEGKLERVNALCNLIIKLELVSKSVIKRYQNIVHQYYRYYNNGEYPKIVYSYGVRKFNGDVAVEKALECALDTVMALVLKASNSELRSVVRKRKAHTRLNILKAAIEHLNLPSVIPNPENATGFNQEGYWFSQLVGFDHDKMPTLKAKVESLRPYYRNVREFVDTNTPEFSNKVLSYVSKSYIEMEDSETKTEFLNLLSKLVEETSDVVKIIEKELEQRPFVSDEELEEAFA